MLRTLSLIALIMALPRSGASFSVFTDDAVSPAVASRVSKLLRSVDTAVEVSTSLTECLQNSFCLVSGNFRCNVLSFISFSECRY